MRERVVKHYYIFLFLSVLIDLIDMSLATASLFIPIMPNFLVDIISFGFSSLFWGACGIGEVFELAVEFIPFLDTITDFIPSVTIGAILFYRRVIKVQYPHKRISASLGITPSHPGIYSNGGFDMGKFVTFIIIEGIISLIAWAACDTWLGYGWFLTIGLGIFCMIPPVKPVPGNKHIAVGSLITIGILLIPIIYYSSQDREEYLGEVWMKYNSNSGWTSVNPGFGKHTDDIGKPPEEEGTISRTGKQIAHGLADAVENNYRRTGIGFLDNAVTGGTKAVKKATERKCSKGHIVPQGFERCLECGGQVLVASNNFFNKPESEMTPQEKMIKAEILEVKEEGGRMNFSALWQFSSDENLKKADEMRIWRRDLFILIFLIFCIPLLCGLTNRRPTSMTATDAKAKRIKDTDLGISPRPPA